MMRSVSVSLSVEIRSDEIERRFFVEAESMAVAVMSVLHTSETGVACAVQCRRTLLLRFGRFDSLSKCTLSVGNGRSADRYFCLIIRGACRSIEESAQGLRAYALAQSPVRFFRFISFHFQWPVQYSIQ